VLSVGCATTSSATPSAPVELDGTRWKLVVAGGRMDGRVVQFKKKGIGYEGIIMEGGVRLAQTTGVDYGKQWIFSIKPRGTNEYTGVYKNIMTDGSFQDQELELFVSGDTFSWNLESATWELQK
jgi:hypothetical protein